MAWDLRYPSSDLIALNPRPRGEFEPEPQGLLAPPGQYTAQLVRVSDGTESKLAKEVTFNVTPLYQPSDDAPSQAKVMEFWSDYTELQRSVGAFQSAFSKKSSQISALDRALKQTNIPTDKYANKLSSIKKRHTELKTAVNGSSARAQIGEKDLPTIGEHMFSLYRGISNSTYGPTDTHLDIVKWVEASISNYNTELDGVDRDIKEIAALILEYGGPYIEGM